MSAAAIGPSQGDGAVARRRGGVRARSKRCWPTAATRLPCASPCARWASASACDCSDRSARLKFAPIAEAISQVSEHRHAAQRQSRSHPAPPPGNRRPPVPKAAAPITRKLSRELAELEPVVAAITAYRAKERERADLTRMIDDPATDGEMRAMAREELDAAEAEAAAMWQEIRRLAAAQGRRRRRQRHSRSARRDGRRRGGFVRRRPLPHVSEICRVEALEGRSALHERRHGGRLQGDHRRDRRTRRLRPAQVRKRRASRAARAGDRDAGAHPHFRRHRGRAAGGAGDRPRHQRSRI